MQGVLSNVRVIIWISWQFQLCEIEWISTDCTGAFCFCEVRYEHSHQLNDLLQFEPLRVRQQQVMFFFVEITGVFECCYRNSNETSKTKNLKNGTEKSEKFQFKPLCLIWIGQKTLNHWAFSLWPWSCLISIKYGNNPLKESWFPLHRRLIRVMVMRAFFIVERHITVYRCFALALWMILRPI